VSARRRALERLRQLGVEEETLFRAHPDLRRQGGGRVRRAEAAGRARRRQPECPALAGGLVVH